MLRKAIVTLALVVTSVFSAQAADFKVGVVDTKLVMSKAPQLKAGYDSINERFKERQNELAELQKQGQELKQQAERDQMTMTNLQRLELDRKLQALDAQFTIKKKFLQEDLQIAQNQEQQKVAQKISQAINKIAADEKFDLIITKDVVIFAKETIDLSEKVLSIISNPAG